MSITAENGCRELLRMALAERPLDRLRVAEFGNQMIKTSPDSGMRRLQSSKALMEWLGVARWTSFDKNGEHHAEPVDLGRPFAPDYGLESFDVVTNFGTSEHVRRGQRICFWNAHQLCRRGGLMLHCVPETGSCRKHGRWKYSVEWFEWLAQVNHYEIVLLDRFDKAARIAKLEPGSEWYVRAALRKRRSRFCRNAKWRQPMKV